MIIMTTTMIIQIAFKMHLAWIDVFFLIIFFNVRCPHYNSMNKKGPIKRNVKHNASVISLSLGET